MRAPGDRQEHGMNIIATALPDVRIYQPKRLGDARGYFCEWYNERAMAAAGLDCRFVQDNMSFSSTPGTLRGLHFQRPPHAQGKLVGVLRGAILDVAVDLRRGSPTFGRHVAVELSAELGNQLFIPVGFAHGLWTLTPDTLVSYKVTDFFDAECDAGVAWNDPDLAVAWPASGPPAVLSDRDSRLPKLAALGATPFVYEGSR
jgi:dTDP-4-dehydrorhamnose 3,5-epimerase